MQYKETLLWILDKDCKPAGIRGLDGKIKANVDFVRSLGLKCDSVGWCSLELDRPDIDGLFEKIGDFCCRENWGVRAWYKREFAGESEWYALWTAQFKDNASADRVTIPDRNGGELWMERIKAYADLSPGPRAVSHFVAVPERFREVCLENRIPVDFFWLEDRGRYRGTQYFCIVPTQSVPRAAVSGYKHRDENDPAMFEQLGGKLPKVMELCYDVWRVELPQTFLASDLPAGGIVLAYLPHPGISGLPPTILIHADTAELLIREKALSWKQLTPVPVVAEFPAGYRIQETAPLRLPPEDFIAKGFAQYESLKANPRPVRQVSEKDALKLLRTAKRERKEDFQKALPKAAALEPEFKPLLPYWQITSGGYVSDEYKLLAPEAARTRTEAFRAAMAQEGLLEEKPEGVVFAVCPDGDRVLLTPEGTVERWSHEAPEILEQWPALAQFFGDNLQT